MFKHLRINICVNKTGKAVVPGSVITVLPTTRQPDCLLSPIAYYHSEKKRCVIDLTVKCEIEHDRQADKGEKEQQNKRRIGFSFLCICLKVSLLVKQIACKTRANQTVIVDV